MILFYRAYNKDNPVFQHHLYKLINDLGFDKIVVIYDATDKDPFESKLVKSYNFTIADIRNSGYPAEYDKHAIAEMQRVRGSNAPIPYPQIYYNCEYPVLMAIKALNLDFDYAWSVEWDVAIAGDWKEAFDELAVSKADFIGPYLRHPETELMPYSWPVAKEDRYISFGCIHRYSKKLLEVLDIELRAGKHSFYEQIIPTVAHINKLSIVDLDLAVNRWFYRWDTINNFPEETFDQFMQDRQKKEYKNMMYHPIIKDYV